MKNPNNYGSITKLTGTRRKPWMVRIYKGMKVNHETKKAYPEQAVLGYYATRKEAMDALAEYNLNPYNIDRNTVTIRELWEQIKDKIDASEDRKKVYQRCFEKYLDPIADKRITDVRTALLQELVDACDYGYATQSNIRSVLNRIYNYAQQNDIVYQNYAKYVKIDAENVQIQRNLYTPEEVAALWEHQDQTEYLMTIILLHQGMRLKELRDLPKNNVNLAQNTIKITEAKNPQSKREIPIHKRVRPIIERLMEEPGDKLFNITARQYSYFADNVLHHKAYDVRHTFASRANELGINKLIIQRIMGHKPDSVLEQSYIHLTMEELQQAIDQVCY